MLFTKSLPLPLTELKTRELLKEHKLYKNKLIECNLRLVVFYAKRYENKCNYIEDLVPIGCIGLIKAINEYKGHNGLFAKYLESYITSEIEKYLERGETKCTTLIN